MSKYLMCVIVAMVGLSGCVTMTSNPLSKAELNQAIAQAEERAVTRGVDVAISELQNLTKSNPTDGEPWSKMAKIYFDQEQYGQAIVAADEALQRNPSDFLAKSIWVVGGLRLAQKGVLDMKNSTKLLGNAEQDAVALANAMRSALGESILLPVSSPSARPKVTPPTRTSGRNSSTGSSSSSQPPREPAASPKSSPSEGKADPFGSLR